MRLLLSSISRALHPSSYRFPRTPGSTFRRSLSMSAPTATSPNKGSWRALSAKGDVPQGRSSNASGVIGTTFYTFSGEFTPRVPLDNTVYALNLTTQQWTVLPATATSPSARVGHAATVVGGKLYVYGGRVGKEFADQTLDDLHAFDPASNTWQAITPTTATRPPPLSYHTLTASPTHIYLFGGCTVDHGRSSAVWAFDVTRSEWQQLAQSATQNGPMPCGGPSFVYTPDPPTLHALFGYNGKEELDTHYILTLDAPTSSTAGWQQQPSSAAGERPAPRSVTDTVYLAALNALFTFGGEYTPSVQGHEGAGSYHDTAYVYRLDSRQWQQVSSGGSGGGPSARGWFNTCALEDGKSAVVFGGFDGNTRVNDVFVWTADESQ